ncbi:trypsin-like serine protease [Kribbella sandramycini]|uniref:Trypsin-like serine protease n=1 Tax=Kribbella sandramycini TaxID=60450 RepID=A0A7Y4KX91_9ACTN|nr:hypothetical protein [Kribbella sandramycini]NOL39687.1 trypsin-like serine protease [Kribbella sandramycini]
MFRRKFVALAAVLVVASGYAGLGVQATPAAAGSAAGSAGAEELGGATAEERAAMERQVPLVAAANLVQDAVEEVGAAHYSGIVLREAHVDVYWKGAVSPLLSEVVERASAPVRIHPAAYSIVELRAASAKIEAAWPGDPDDLYGIRMIPDGSGLEVSSPANRRVAVPNVGVPITLVDEGRFVAASRRDDFVPWSGGAQIYNGNRGNSCTSGFGVINPAGAQYILTASHCAGNINGESFYNGTGSRFIGHMGPRHHTHDIALIPTNRVSNTVYTGSEHGGPLARVIRRENVFVGQYVCQSGYMMARQNGGARCNIEVTRFRTTADRQVEARQRSGLRGAFAGDSGGPVYSICCNGLLGLGTLTHVNIDYPSFIRFQDLATARRDFGGIEPISYG